MLSLTLTLATVAVAFVGLAERQLHLAQPDLACANNDCLHWHLPGAIDVMARVHQHLLDEWAT